MRLDAVIFDLDGTLVDSAPGILQSMAQALQACGQQPALPLDTRLIGPPLGATLARLCPRADAHTLADLTAAFKRHYDQAGYQLSLPYVGMEALLHGLRARRMPCLIATNKRLLPTTQIIQQRAWAPLFDAVYAPDSLQPPAASKGDLLCQVLARHGLAPAHTLYVGDRWEDALAARQAGMPFFFAHWGYADGPLPEPVALQGDVADLQHLLQGDAL